MPDVESLRIAMVTAAITRRGAGVAASVEGLSLALASNGHTVRVFTLADCDPLSKQEAWRGAPAVEFPVRGPQAFGFAPNMLKAILEWEADIVHLHGLWMYTSCVASAWGRRTGRPYVISPHGMLAPSALGFSQQKKRLARILYQERCFKHASAFHATSYAEADDIKLFCANQPIDMVPHGIYVRSQPHNSVRRKTVLSLGRLHPVKGLDVLIAAWAQLEAQFPDWELEIIGPDEDGHKQQLQALIDQKGLQRCQIGAPLYGDDKYRCIAQASIFVLPSRSENFGLTVLESLLMETPVIASQGTPWSVLKDQGCGDWVLLGADSFAEAMSRHMEASEGDRKAMGERGRSLVLTSYSWQAVAHKAAASYQRLVKNSPNAKPDGSIFGGIWALF